jgi:predicted CXXCH cytochrome family protein
MLCLTCHTARCSKSTQRTRHYMLHSNKEWQPQSGAQHSDRETQNTTMITGDTCTAPGPGAVWQRTASLRPQCKAQHSHKALVPMSVACHAPHLGPARSGVALLRSVLCFNCHIWLGTEAPHNAEDITCSIQPGVAASIRSSRENHRKPLNKAMTQATQAPSGAHGRITGNLSTKQ